MVAFKLGKEESRKSRDMRESERVGGSVGCRFGEFEGLSLLTN